MLAKEPERRLCRYDELSEIFLRERKCTLLMVGIIRVAELGWLDIPMRR